MTRHTPVKATFNPFHHASHVASHSRGREVKNKRVQACVKRAAQQGLIPPIWTFPLNDAHNVRDVVGAET